MPNSWIKALKIWNRDKPKYTVPKKGTKGYNEVKKIQKGNMAKSRKGGISVAVHHKNKGRLQKDIDAGRAIIENGKIRFLT